MRSYLIAGSLLALPLLFGHANTAHATTYPACAPAWKASTVYNNAGTEVSQYGVNYKNNWYIQGSSPETNSGPSEVWSEVNVCHACEVKPMAPTKVTAVATSDIKTDLIWQAPMLPVNCAITGYTVYKSGAKFGTTTWNNLGISSLKAKTKYSFTVTAGDSVGSSGKSAAASVTTMASGMGRGPTPWYAPYMDMSQNLAETMPTLAKNGTIQHFSAAFITSPQSGSNECQAYWFGSNSLTNDRPYSNGESIKTIVTGVRNKGGDVIISFGGANGTMVAAGCSASLPTNPTKAQFQAVATKVQAIYQSVLNRYKVTYIDFDIEGANELNQHSLTVRDLALIGLRKVNAGLVISFTLPVNPTGLDDNGNNIIVTAKKDGFTPDVVNIMAMDYGPNVDAAGAGMGANAIMAANNTALQIAAAGLTSHVGVTPMLGVNDDTSEIFGFGNAVQLVNWAKANPDISRLAEWSANRDNGGCAGYRKSAVDNCSGLKQSNFEFAADFKPFNQ